MRQGKTLKPTIRALALCLGPWQQETYFPEAQGKLHVKIRIHFHKPCKPDTLLQPSASSQTLDPT